MVRKRNISPPACTTVVLTFLQVFLIDVRCSDRVPCASNAPKREVLAAETKTAASSHQQPTTERSLQSAPPSMTLMIRTIDYKGKIVTQKWPIYIPCVQTSSTIQSALLDHGEFLISSRPACCPFLHCYYLGGRTHFCIGN